MCSRHVAITLKIILSYLRAMIFKLLTTHFKKFRILSYSWAEYEQREGFTLDTAGSLQFCCSDTENTEPRTLFNQLSISPHIKHLVLGAYFKSLCSVTLLLQFLQCLQPDLIKKPNIWPWLTTYPLSPQIMPLYILVLSLISELHCL